MSFCVASYFICSPRASSASATSASSPTEGAPPCCHCASPLSTPLHRKTNRKPRPLLRAPAVALSQVRRTDGRRRTIHSRTTPTPFSTAPGHGCMKSLAHTPHCRRASERLAEVCLRYRPDIFFLSPPRLTSAIDSSLHRSPAATPPTLTTPANLYTPLSLHSICISPASAAPAASF